MKTWMVWAWLLRLCFLMNPALSGESSKYSEYYDSHIRPLMELRFPGVAEQEALNRLLHDQELSPDEIYAIRRHILLLAEDFNLKGYQEVSRLIQPRSDDFLLQSSLVLHEVGLDYQKRVDKVVDLFERAALEDKGKSTAGWVALDAIDLMTEHFDVTRASLLVQRALATIPPETPFLRANLLEAIARIYVDPSNSPEIIQKGLAIYAEAEAFTRRIKEPVNAANTAYNQGIGELLGLHNDEEALKHFSRVSPESFYHMDAKVFSALALAHLGRNEEAISLLRQVDFNHYNESKERVAFLFCYMSIVKYRVGQKSDLTQCTNLSKDTQVDVIQHVTDELLQLALPENLELAVLRQFQKFYQNKIRKQNMQRSAQSIDALELSRSKVESEQNRFLAKISRVEAELAQEKFKLVMYAAISALVLFALLALGFWRYRIAQRKIEEFQQILQTRILQRFLPPALVEEIRLGHSQLEAEPQKRLVTILFADLVEFTRKSEQLGTDRIALLLNSWMHIATDVIFLENGTIDKFVGDGVMVIFGAPLEISPETQVTRAVRCAQRLMQAMQEQNILWQQEYGVTFQLRVGINLGDAIVGSFGSEKRSDYTVIGGAVNLASRLEHMAEPGQILLSERAARSVDRTWCKSLGMRRIRGISEGLEVFAIHDTKVDQVG